MELGHVLLLRLRNTRLGLCIRLATKVEVARSAVELYF